MAAPQARVEDLLREISEKLDHILNVLSMSATEGKSMTDAARLLKLAGLDNQTIAAVLNTSPPTIRTLTANLRARSPR